MNIQDKKNYLKQYKRAVKKIAAIEMELHDLHLMQLPSGIDYSKDKIQTSSTGDQMLNFAARLDELETNLMNEKIKAVNVCTEILNTISAIENDTYQTVLHRRYILLQSWEDIAKDMNYSPQRLYEIHGEALAEVVRPE